MKEPYTLCPICGQHKFSSEDGDYPVCPHCGWIHDFVDENESNSIHGPNKLPISQFKLRYNYYLRKNPLYHWAHDGFPDIDQIEPMECPICGKYKFEELTLDDLYCGESPADVFCPDCGWHYDLAQTKNPDLKNGANTKSLNEYRIWYAETIKNNPNYSYFESRTDEYVPSPHICPVCGRYKFEDTCCFDICPWCGWEDDGTENDTDILGANDLRFSLYKKRYNDYIAKNPKYRWDKNGKP